LWVAQWVRTTSKFEAIFDLFLPVKFYWAPDFSKFPENESMLQEFRPYSELQLLADHHREKLTVIPIVNPSRLVNANAF
jgi:hypothetical protein